MTKGKVSVMLAAVIAMASLSGCSRSTLNYQVAECIGTLGEHENNEPVETPKMRAQREEQEQADALEEEKIKKLEEADLLAKQYFYEEAIELIEKDENFAEDERAAEAIASYQEAKDSLYEYSGEIGHLCFTNLVVDTARAFDDDQFAQTYKQNMITLTEFENILNALYNGGYVLIDIHALVNEAKDERGNLKMEELNPTVPDGKKPIVISVDNLNYNSVRNGDGVAVGLALDENGKVGALYTDEGGHDLIGAYDVVPVLDQFIEEHPDFSYRGAKGIISVTASEGAFGYQVEDDGSQNYAENRKLVKTIAQELAAEGWNFASEGYSYARMSDLSYEELRAEITRWQNTVGALLGNVDILLYPYGAEVDYETEKAVLLVNQGYHYLVGLWSDKDFKEVKDTYMRQTRRTVTGYVLENYPSNCSTYFSTPNIIDPAR